MVDAIMSHPWRSLAVMIGIIAFVVWRFKQENKFYKEQEKNEASKTDESESDDIDF